MAALPPEPTLLGPHAPPCALVCGRGPGKSGPLSRCPPPSSEQARRTAAHRLPLDDASEQPERSSILLSRSPRFLSAGSVTLDCEGTGSPAVRGENRQSNCVSSETTVKHVWLPTFLSNCFRCDLQDPNSIFVEKLKAIGAGEKCWLGERIAGFES